MNQPVGVRWGSVAANALWIFGAAVVLAVFSLRDYRRRSGATGADGGTFSETKPSKTPLYLGLALIAAGVSLTARVTVVAELALAAGAGFVIMIIKNLRIE